MESFDNRFTLQVDFNDMECDGREENKEPY